MSFDFYVANVYAPIQRGLTVIPPGFLRWGIWVKKLSIRDWDISGLHTGACESGNGCVLGRAGTLILHPSCSAAARWGLSPSCWVQGANPAQTQGVKRFISCWNPFIAPFLEESGWQWWSEAESPAAGWRHPLSVSACEAELKPSCTA